MGINFLKMLFQSLYLIVGSVSLVLGSDPSCGDIFAINGLNSSSFAAGVAHGLHSLSLEELRYYFEEDAPEDNNIPTANINLKDDEAVLDHVPLRGFEDRFNTWSLKIMDWYMLNNNKNIFQKGLNVMEKIIHQYHMHEVFQKASVIYKDLSGNPPSSELCDCITDEEFNGIHEELNHIAEELRKKHNGKRRRKRQTLGGYLGGYIPSWSPWEPTFPWSSWSIQPIAIEAMPMRSRHPENNVGNLEQAYLNNSTKETAFPLISLGKWTPGTFKGKKQWINLAAMLTFNMLTEEQIGNFAIFIYCKFN